MKQFGFVLYLWALLAATFIKAQDYYQVNDPEIMGTITFITPLNDEIVPSGESLDIEWTADPAPTATTAFILSLHCPVFPTQTITVTGVQTALFPIPVDFYGSSCSISIESADYDTAYVNLVVTQDVSIESPVEGTVYQLGLGGTFPVRLITSGGNIFDLVQTTLICDQGIETFLNFTTNSPLVDQPADPSQVGKCTMTIEAADLPNYLVAPDESVSFDLQYNLLFTTLPTNLYPDQDFNIQLSTESNAVNPPAVDLLLDCSGTANPVAFWSDVNINTLETLTLPEDIVVDVSCTFKVEQNEFYAEVVSSPVPITKIPVTIEKPSTAHGAYIQNQPIDLSVITSALPAPFGNVSLLLTCPNMIEPLIISTAVNSPSSFIPTENAYGSCELKVASDDPIYVGTSSVVIQISYALTLINPPSVIYLNQSFDITIETIPSVPADLKTDLELFCNGIPQYNWINVPLNTLQTLLAPSTVSVSGPNCLLQTSGSPIFVPASANVAVETLLLYFAEPATTSFTQPDVMIPIKVSTNSMQNPIGFVDISLVCGEDDLSFPVDINEETSIDIPSDIIGPCTLTATSDIYTVPSPVTLAINVILTITDSPPVVFVNHDFNITIESNGNTEITPTLQLLCSGSVVTSWPNQQVNTPLTLLVPTTVSQNSDCSFITAPALYEILSAPAPVNVKNVDLIFVQPVEGTFEQTESVTIQVDANPFPETLQEINVTWTCSSAGFSEQLPMITTESQTIPIPSSVFGPCTLSVNPPPAGFNSPIPATFNVLWQLDFGFYQKTLYLTQSFSVLIEPILPVDLATSTSVTLVCDGLVMESWFNVPFGQLTELELDGTVPPSTNCLLQTNTDNPYVLEATSGQVTVNKVSMTIEMPSDGEIVPSPERFDLLVSTATNTSIVYASNAKLTCGNATKLIPFVTNEITSVDYDEHFYGKCIISVPTVASYFNPPADVNIFIKFVLEFAKAPQSIKIGQTFLLEVIGQGSVPEAIAFTNIDLHCYGEIVQSWNQIPLGVPEVFTLDGSFPPSNQCFFRTSGNEIDFIQAESPVAISFIPSPLGGELFFISRADIEKFAKSISSSFSTLWMEITNNYM